MGGGVGAKRNKSWKLVSILSHKRSHGKQIHCCLVAFVDGEPFCCSLLIKIKCN